LFIFLSTVVVHDVEDLCGWTVDAELSGSPDFLFGRTRGADQDGLHGPNNDHNFNNTSKLRLNGRFHERERQAFVAAVSH
jgi:hypothetical protein